MMSHHQPCKKPRLTTERLPNDVVFDILNRLPVKSIVQFRCVSKACNSIITDPIFITTHIDRANSLSNNNNNYGYVIFLDYRENLCTVVYNSDRTLTHIGHKQGGHACEVHIDKYSWYQICNLSIKWSSYYVLSFFLSFSLLLLNT